jgi:uncharacterized membrane protein
MRRFSLAAASVFVLGTTYTAAWAPAVHQRHAGMVQNPTSKTYLNLKSAHDDDVVVASFDPLNLSSSADAQAIQVNPAVIVGAAALACPSAAWAASTAPDAIPSALVAYGHYLSILLMTASVMTERLTIKPAMSIEEEQRLSIADIMTGVSGLILTISGYYRATEYGKGWDFYSHEPVFWLKMAFLGIFGGLSLFPTITIIQRSVKIQQEGTIEPMSEKLASRMTSIMNAELTALAFIPLTATFMSRGVGYVDGFPTQIVGPAFFGVITAGAVFKYVKDALTWTEDEVLVAKEEQ